MSYEQLYPEVAAAGGLAPALLRVAERKSITLSGVRAPDGPEAQNYASVGSDRGWVSVTLGIELRVFIVRVGREREVWASGSTEDLLEAVRVAALWQQGCTLRQLHERFPFMTYGRLAQGWEDGDPVGAQWEDVLADPDLERLRPLLRAARAHPRLGQLFPAVTHLTLARFLIKPQRGAPQVRIALTPDGYAVDSSWSETPRRVQTIDDAINEAAAQLPPPPQQ